MRVEVRPCEIRALVLAVFRELGADLGSLSDLEESILIHEGRYLARSYRAEALMAMWLVAAGLVQFYDADGNMLRTINLGEERRPLKMAA